MIPNSACANASAASTSSHAWKRAASVNSARTPGSSIRNEVGSSCMLGLLSTVRNKYAEGCQPLLTRKTHGDPPRQTGGGTAYRNWPPQFGGATSRAQHPGAALSWDGPAPACPGSHALPASDVPPAPA